MKQEGISRLEKRSDMLISTLSKYVTAMGGTLKLMATFPNRPPVELHGIAEIEAVQSLIGLRVPFRVRHEVAYLSCSQGWNCPCYRVNLGP
jgi:hypothetical protein